MSTVTTSNGNTSKYPKVILRKPEGTKENFGWVGEVLMSKTERKFVPETFSENYSDEEKQMTKAGHIIKAIADSTRYAAVKGYNYSTIIAKFGVDAMQSWDAFAKATEERRDARKKVDAANKGDERKRVWDEIKDPYNRAVRRALLKMDLLAEDIFANSSPAKTVGE